MSLSGKLETWRNDLIDMSRRNPMLYYKSEGYRAAGIQFLPESPSALFAQLRGRPGTVALSEIPCALSPEDLERRPLSLRLLRLYLRVREDERDRGIRTLYLAFGVLEWYESPSSQEAIHSPLIFLPVKLEYKRATDSFTLKFVEDIECEINPTLREYLNYGFKITLPTFSEVISDDPDVPVTLDAILRGIGEALPQQGGSLQDERWTIHPEVHLGRFAFQKLVMYQDLRRHASEVLAHPLLQVLGGEAVLPAPTSWLPSPREFDDNIHPQRVLEILDADSSQQEAIQWAKADVSFVLKGPPGTGKSQTIANIIAVTLGQGKKVLFVSEKMAALDVVRTRLQQVGLGDFCLDLHSSQTDSAQKSAFFNALKTSLDDVSRPPEERSDGSWALQSSNLERQRRELNSYVRELHQPRQPLGKSAFWAYAELARLADAPDFDFAIPNVDAITPDQFDAKLRTINALDACRDVLDTYETHPWRETRATSHSLELESNIRDHYTRLSANLRTLHDALAAMVKLLGEHAAINFAWMDFIVRHAEVVLESPLPLGAWLSREELARLRPQVADMVARSREYLAWIAQFTPVYNRALLAEDLTTLQESLSEENAQKIASLRDEMESPRDTAIAQHDELDKRLTAASRALAAIPPVANTLAELCGAEQPETLGETKGLIALARHLSQSPNPPSEWLNPSKFAVVRALAAEARERYWQCAQLRGALEGVYQPQFFTLDLHGMAERFRTQYRSFFRFLQTSYRRDIKMARSLLLPGQTRTAAQVEADLYQAVKLLDMEAGLNEKRVDYAQTLDHYFDGAQTDWEQVTAALRWVTQLHEYLAGIPVSSAMAALITGPAKALRAMNATLDTLAQLVAAWADEESYCVSRVWVSRLLPGIIMFDDAAPEQACVALDALLSDLRIFWQAVDTVQRHRHMPPEPHQPMSWVSLRADVALARAIQAFETRLTEKADEYSSDFGRYFTGVTTNWQAIDDALAWTERFLTHYADRAVPEPTLALVTDPENTVGRDELRQALTMLQQTWPHMDAELTFSDTVLARTALNKPGKTFETTPLVTLADHVDFHLRELPALHRWLTCQQRLHHCGQVGLDGFIASLMRHGPIPQNLAAIFQRRFYKLWLDHVRSQSPTLARFRGEEHSVAIDRFRNLDAGHLTLARRRLNALLRQRRRHAFQSSAGKRAVALSQADRALRREAQKKRHSPIRVTVRKAARALLELKPCWMMSPLSVSLFLDSAEQLFDLVIFDEASQVCPEDSISAILRGKQLIVVGDPRQLPPTRFFSKSLADESGDEDEEDEENEQKERTQSILDECRASSFNERSLEWHYRSADEALIAFSNHHFYDDQLVTFPSPLGATGQGVRFEYVENSNYRRGRNTNEAARVADIVFDHLQQHEDPSLGIVALSAAQQEAITEALENRIKRDPRLEPYFDALFIGKPDGIFIKNLESVQGDERDTIILSVGYGPDVDGNIYKRFGPVNNAGGERRLNVAVTRARKQMIVVSSMRASDLPPHMASLGARTLRDYLLYAEACSNGGAQAGRQALSEQSTASDERAMRLTESRFESPFEEAVYNALTARGLMLDTQVGCSRYRIDLAVRDPEHPGAYLLGIECDGASYHSSKTARDRDRLRQWQLEHMGWKLHRIWSSDWFATPTVEVLRVLDAVAEIMNRRAGGEIRRGLQATVGAPNDDDIQDEA